MGLAARTDLAAAVTVPAFPTDSDETGMAGAHCDDNGDDDKDGTGDTTALLLLLFRHTCVEKKDTVLGLQGERNRQLTRGGVMDGRRRIEVAPAPPPKEREGKEEQPIGHSPEEVAGLSFTTHEHTVKVTGDQHHRAEEQGEDEEST